MAETWVIVVGYRNAAEVQMCLRAVEQQSYQNWGVIVCENGGAAAFLALQDCLEMTPVIAAMPGETSSAVRQASSFENNHRPYILLEARQNLGYAGAINAALHYITPDQRWRYVWILNPDTNPHPDALAALVRKAGSLHYGVIGSRLIYQGTGLIQAYGGAWRRFTARGHSLGRSQPAAAFVDVAAIEAKMDYVLGASMLVTRQYVTDIGPMDDRYFLYCEEVDWCLRRRAYRLGYAHDSIIFHVQGTTIGSRGSSKQRSHLAIYLDERNRLLVSRRFYRRMYPLIVCVTGFCLLRYLKSAAWRSFFVAVQGWWAGLRHEAGPLSDQRFANRT